MALSNLLWFLDPKTEPGTKLCFRKCFLNIAGPDSHSHVSEKLRREGSASPGRVPPTSTLPFPIALRTVCSGLCLHRPARAKVLGCPNGVGAVFRFVAEARQNIFRGSSVTLVLTEFCFASQGIRS